MKLLLLAVALVVPTAASAGQCPELSGASTALRGLDADARLRFVRQRLAREQGRARLWTGAWGGGYAALSLGQLAAMPLLGPADQIDNAIGVFTSVVGVAELVAFPLDVLSDQPTLEARLPNLLAGPNPCAALAEAERVFVRDAESEASGVTWLMHGANLAFNVLVGLVMGLGYGHWEAGAIEAATGFALGEATLFTQPTGLVGDLDRYRAGHFDAPAAESSWRLGAGGLSLQLSGRF